VTARHGPPDPEAARMLAELDAQLAQAARPLGLTAHVPGNGEPETATLKAPKPPVHPPPNRRQRRRAAALARRGIR
jgi:hypothetical protein